MPDVRNFRLRVTFCKQGRLALLSHLEVARALERAVRRAGLPFAISQGFSPHMKIAFGAALPVGVGGTHEVFDLQMTRFVPPDQVLSALQTASASDLMVKECHYIEHDALAASVAYPVSTYRALLSCAPVRLLLPFEIMMIRKKKEKVLRVSDFLVGEVDLVGATLTFSLESKPTGSLRPDVLLRSCLRQTGMMNAGEETPSALVVENRDCTLVDVEPCEERGLPQLITMTRIDQRPSPEL